MSTAKALHTHCVTTKGSRPSHPFQICCSCQLQAHHNVRDAVAAGVILSVAMCRERAQQHYQRLTRELTQGQLLRLAHRDSFVQQASFVLLKGELYVRGETEGDSLLVSGSVFGSVFGFRVALMLAARHVFRGLFLTANTSRSQQVLQQSVCDASSLQSKQQFLWQTCLEAYSCLRWVL